MLLLVIVLALDTRSILAGSQGRDVEMCEAFDNAALLDEPLAESERDHVLASYRPAKQSVSEEIAEQILGNLHLPPLPENADQQTNPQTKSANERSPHHDDTTHEQDNELLQHYLNLFRNGKIPPEAFPIDSPIRTHAEKIYTGDST